MKETRCLGCTKFKRQAVAGSSGFRIIELLTSFRRFPHISALSPIPTWSWGALPIATAIADATFTVPGVALQEIDAFRRSSTGMTCT